MNARLILGMMLSLTLAGWSEPAPQQLPPQAQLTQTAPAPEVKQVETAPKAAPDKSEAERPKKAAKRPLELKFRDFFDARHQPSYPNS